MCEGCKYRGKKDVQGNTAIKPYVPHSLRLPFLHLYTLNYQCMNGRLDIFYDLNQTSGSHEDLRFWQGQQQRW